MKYKALTRFWNNGKVDGKIFLESEQINPEELTSEEFDSYLDEFDSFEKAMEFINKTIKPSS
jgi:hypothetical protein